MRSLFPNALHVARREYLFRIRGRAFIIATALLGIAVAALTMVPTILAAVVTDDPPEIAVSVEADDLSTDPVVAVQALLIAAADPGAVLEGEAPAPATDGAERARVTRTQDRDTAAATSRPSAPSTTRAPAGSACCRSSPSSART